MTIQNEKIAKLQNLVSIIFLFAAIFYAALGGLGFSWDNYVNMATDQKILVTIDQGINLLIGIFLILLALYFKKENKN